MTISYVLFAITSTVVFDSVAINGFKSWLIVLFNWLIGYYTLEGTLEVLSVADFIWLSTLTGIYVLFYSGILFDC